MDACIPCAPELLYPARLPCIASGVGKTMLSETIQGHSHAKTRRTWEHQVMRPQCVQLAVPLIDDQLAKLDLSDTVRPHQATATARTGDGQEGLSPLLTAQLLLLPRFLLYSSGERTGSSTR